MLGDLEAVEATTGANWIAGGRKSALGVPANPMSTRVGKRFQQEDDSNPKATFGIGECVESQKSLQ
jgi:hypothetical protein